MSRLAYFCRTLLFLYLTPLRWYALCVHLFEVTFRRFTFILLYLLTLMLMLRLAQLQLPQPQIDDATVTPAPQKKPDTNAPPESGGQ